MKKNKTITGILDFSVLAFIVFLIMMMLFWGCKHEPIVPLLTIENSGTGVVNDSTVYNGIPCDPDSVYFTNNILPLFISNCAKSGCHDVASHEEGIILDTYDHVINTGDIEPGRPSSGKIIDVVSSSDPDKKMPPPPNTSLNSNQINMITTWINQGALNNSCSSCDTVNVTYSATIAPLLQTKCVGCHNAATTSGNINLSNYIDVKTEALNGRLSGSVNHTAGFSFMPKGGAKLPQCELDELNLWIASGAPQN